MRILCVIVFFASTCGFGQTGPAGVGTNDGYSALKLWLKADNGVFGDSLGKSNANDGSRVRKWSDLSGAGNDVFALADSSRPTYVLSNDSFNSNSTILFNRSQSKDNTHNYLTSKSFIHTNDMTIFCVFHPRSKGGGNDVSPYVGVSKDSSWFGGSRIVDADVVGPKNDISMTLTDTSLAAGGGDSTTKIEYSVKTPLVLNKTYIGATRRDRASGLFGISKNGEIESYVKGGTQPINNSAYYTIGSGRSSAIYGPITEFFDGYVASVLIYNSKLSESETIILNNYLSAKYAVQLVQNDFYKMDDASHGNYDFDMAAIGMGADMVAQIDAVGEGIIQINKPTDLGKGEYLFWAHNALSLNYQNQDFPDGVQQRLKRTWRVSEVGETGKIDLTIDTRSFGSADVKDLVLIVDVDNDGLFDDETLGEGLIVNAAYIGNGKYLFRNVNLNNENRFTFGTLKPTCQTDCDAAFSPNGDGVSDTYYVDNVGKTVVYDKFGTTIKVLQTPAYWDGRKTSGEMAIPGLYFFVTNDSQQKVVTLVR